MRCQCGLVVKRDAPPAFTMLPGPVIEASCRATLEASRCTGESLCSWALPPKQAPQSFHKPIPLDGACSPLAFNCPSHSPQRLLVRVLWISGCILESLGNKLMCQVFADGPALSSLFCSQTCNELAVNHRDSKFRLSARKRSRRHVSRKVVRYGSAHLKIPMTCVDIKTPTRLVRVFKDSLLRNRATDKSAPSFSRT
ncbi:hypothetical protein SAMN05444172_8357 [Burkholderia sp. GAS332]|nr:hypothetical protein SAMN05444172_8357 [Burkholderia sp. GAS332]